MRIFIGLIAILTMHAYADPLPISGRDIEVLPDFKDWRFAAKVPLNFKTHHPQGLIKTGSDFILSTVSSGEEKGYLIRFKWDLKALKAEELQRRSLQAADVRGKLYHLSGLDYAVDGKSFWAALAHYNSLGHSRLMRFDLESFATLKEIELKQHIGAVAIDRHLGFLRLFDWGAKHFLSFEKKKDESLEFLALTASREKPGLWKGFAYQDCKSLDPGYALCSAVMSYPFIRRGALDLIHFEGNKLNVVRRFKVPNVAARESDQVFGHIKRPLTQNAMTLEKIVDAGGREHIRFYFVPHDGPYSQLFIYEADLPRVPRSLASETDPKSGEMGLR